MSQEKLAVTAFFAFLLLLGLSVYKDYGLSWDEGLHHDAGVHALEYVVNGNRTLFSDMAAEYGVAFELPLAAAEKAVGWEYPKDSREIYLMRHLCTFLLFYVGVLFFYLLCRRHFGSWKAGLTGAFFLVLSPRIFANSFYNAKDLPFLSLSVIAVYTLLWYLDKKNYSRASVHALACALPFNIRMAGIFVPALTLMFASVDMVFRRPREKPAPVVKSLLLFALLFIALSYAIWPYLWADPANKLWHAYEKTKNILPNANVFYFGEVINAANLPWHYVPVWIAITTPSTYLFLFAVGVIVSLFRILKGPVRFDSSGKETMIFLCWLCLPLAAVIIGKVVIYNGWRHLFFIYPALLIFSLEGLTFLMRKVESKFNGEHTFRLWGFNSKITAGSILTIAVALSLAGTVSFMVKNHPQEGVYFNSLAGSNITEIQGKFDMDYWGLSYRRALEYVLEKDGGERINISVVNYPGGLNALILKPGEKERLVYVENLWDAEYYLTLDGNTRGCPQCKEEFYSIKAEDAKIMVVYKLK